jgi:hypothetical protein
MKMRQGRKADHSPLSSAEIKNGGAIPPFRDTSSWRGDSLIKYKSKFTFYKWRSDSLTYAESLRLHLENIYTPPFYLFIYVLLLRKLKVLKMWQIVVIRFCLYVTSVYFYELVLQY